LSAEPFVRSTTSFGVDLVTGRLKTVPEAPTMGTVVAAFTSRLPGANHWQPSAYSPCARLLYIRTRLSA
jgi:hypothetical protein